MSYYVSNFHINSIIVSGIVAQVYPMGDGTGQLLVQTGLATNGEPLQCWVWFDRENNWEAAAPYVEGTYIVVEAAVLRGENDQLIAQRIQGNRPASYVSGTICNVSEPELIEKLGKKVVTFGLMQKSKDMDKKDVTTFFNCEMYISKKKDGTWDNTLLNKLNDGQFAVVRGTCKIEYFQDNKGVQRSRQTTMVNSLATPYFRKGGSTPTAIPGAVSTGAPSAPPSSMKPPLVGATASTATEVDDDF